jgi:hypothetical protein
LIVTGINFDTGAGAERVVLTSEQYDIPFASAKVGGTQPTTIIPLMPVGLLITGMISVGLSLHPNDDTPPAPLAPIEISVEPSAAVFVPGSVLDMKQAYEHLRQQMLSEGLPLLDAEELEREIADRKATRS